MVYIAFRLESLYFSGQITVSLVIFWVLAWIFAMDLIYLCHWFTYTEVPILTESQEELAAMEESTNDPVPIFDRKFLSQNVLGALENTNPGMDRFKGSQISMNNFPPPQKNTISNAFSTARRASKLLVPDMMAGGGRMPYALPSSSSKSTSLGSNTGMARRGSHFVPPAMAQMRRGSVRPEQSLEGQGRRDSRLKNDSSQAPRFSSIDDESPVSQVKEVNLTSVVVHTDVDKKSDAEAAPNSLKIVPLEFEAIEEEDESPDTKGITDSEHFKSGHSHHTSPSQHSEEDDYAYDLPVIAMKGFPGEPEVREKSVPVHEIAIPIPEEPQPQLTKKQSFSTSGHLRNLGLKLSSAMGTVARLPRRESEMSNASVKENTSSSPPSKRDSGKRESLAAAIAFFNGARRGSRVTRTIVYDPLDSDDAPTTQVIRRTSFLRDRRNYETQSNDSLAKSKKSFRFDAKRAHEKTGVSVADSFINRVSSRYLRFLTK